MVRESLVELGLVRRGPGDPPPAISTGRLRIALLAAIVLGACLAVAVLVVLGAAPTAGR